MKELILGLGIGKVILYLLIINIVGFLAMGIDKWKAKNNMWRRKKTKCCIILPLSTIHNHFYHIFLSSKFIGM